jgi:cell division protein FtsL
MNFEGQGRETEDVQLQDAQVDAALRNFRESVHAWSGQEFGRARVIRRSRWDAMSRVIARPAMVWAMASTLACALLVVSVGVPVSVHHERQVVADRQAALDRERAMQAEAAKQQAAPAMSDDELLSHVDSDIAQAAPDAMEPLASLMSETAAK